MEKKNIVWKLLLSLAVIAAAVLFLSGVIGGSRTYQLPGDNAIAAESVDPIVPSSAPAASG